MQNIINDLIGFIKTLSYVDIVFFVAVLLLIILVVTLINIIRSDDDLEEIDNVLIEAKKEEDNSDIDLASLTSKLAKEKSESPVSLTSYEEEQEAKAIISYEELLKTQPVKTVSYKEESETDDGLKVKAIDVNNLVNTIEPRCVVTKEEYSEVAADKKNLISYDQEEAFLLALKKLQETLEHR